MRLKEEEKLFATMMSFVFGLWALSEIHRQEYTLTTSAGVKSTFFSSVESIRYNLQHKHKSR